MKLIGFHNLSYCSSYSLWFFSFRLKGNFTWLLSCNVTSCCSCFCGFYQLFPVFTIIVVLSRIQTILIIVDFSVEYIVKIMGSICLSRCIRYKKKSWSHHIPQAHVLNIWNLVLDKSNVVFWSNFWVGRIFLYLYMNSWMMDRGFWEDGHLT